MPTNQPPAAPPTCKRCGHETMQDMNGVPFCPNCRKCAKLGDNHQIDRRTLSGVAFTHLPDED